MSITLEILDREELSKKIEEESKQIEKVRKEFLSTAELKERFAKGDNAERNGWCAQTSQLRSSLRLASLLHATGTSAGEIRQMLRRAVQDFAPVVPCYDYSTFEMSVAVPKSQAAKYEGREVSHDLGEVFLAPSPSLGKNYQTVKMKVRKQPAQIEMREALTAALIAHDFDTARTMAADYKLLPPELGPRANHLGVLREGILGNQELALKCLTTVYDGYSPDFPPDRKEVADGVIRRDAKLIQAGLKAATTRFQTAWKLKTYCTPAKLRRLGSAEKMLPKVRSHLMNHNWLMSKWVIAWMSLADHLEIKEAFAEPKLFCEWIPWELCSAASNPLSGQEQATTKKAPARLGKRALKEALEKAIEADDATEIEKLLKAGADIEAKDLSKRTPLLAAAAKGKANAVVALTQAKADWKAEDPQGRNALSWAAEKGQAEIIRSLLQAGAQADGSNSPATHLIYAALSGNCECARLLIEAGANPNRAEHRNRHTPITAAAGSGHEEMVKLLIRAGADVNLPRKSDRAAVLLSAELGNVNILQALLRAGADLKGLYYDITPLHEAANGHHVEAVSLLLKAGAEANAADGYKMTPLHKAARQWSRNQNFEVVAELLLKAGADINAQDSIGQTPLMNAADWPNRIQFLLQAGADPSIKDQQGKTILDHAKNMPASMEMLAKMGCKA